MWGALWVMSRGCGSDEREGGRLVGKGELWAKPIECRTSMLEMGDLASWRSWSAFSALIYMRQRY